MTPIKVNTADGVGIALWRLSADTSISLGPVVLLIHGTFSNVRVCRGLGEYLSAHGFRCWALEWRGHGAADPAPPHTDLSTVAALDMPVAIRSVIEAENCETLYVIGHSGGGLAAAMWAARNSLEADRRVAGLILLAAQATAAAIKWRNRAVLRAYNALIAGTRSALAHRLGVGPERESPSLMREWCRWNLQGRFVGTDGFDYLQGLKAVHVPVFALSAEGDKFIAPQSGCKTLEAAFGSETRRYQHCGLASGFSEDFSHGRIMLSGAARREIWPLLSSWLEEVSGFGSENPKQ